MPDLIGTVSFYLMCSLLFSRPLHTSTEKISLHVAFRSMLVSLCHRFSIQLNETPFTVEALNELLLFNYGRRIEEDVFDDKMMQMNEQDILFVIAECSERVVLGEDVGGFLCEYEWKDLELIFLSALKPPSLVVWIGAGVNRLSSFTHVGVPVVFSDSHIAFEVWMPVLRDFLQKVSSGSTLSEALAPLHSFSRYGLKVPQIFELNEAQFSFYKHTNGLQVEASSFLSNYLLCSSQSYCFSVRELIKKLKKANFLHVTSRTISKNQLYCVLANHFLRRTASCNVLIVVRSFIEKISHVVPLLDRNNIAVLCEIVESWGFSVCLLLHTPDRSNFELINQISLHSPKMKFLFFDNLEMREMDCVSFD